MKQLSRAMLVILPIFSQGLTASSITIEKGDFKKAEKIELKEKYLISAELNDVGLSKIKTLNKSMVGKDVLIKIGHKNYKFKLKVPIEGKNLEFGPFNEESATEIVTEINH